MKNTHLATAASLGDWVRHELAEPEPDSVHIARVITQELGRWFDAETSERELASVADQPVNTGDSRWDALVEGIVARGFHLRKQQPPAWTKRTRLDVGWAPNQHLTPDINRHLINALDTPVELLHKGVIFSRENLVRL